MWEIWERVVEVQALLHDHVEWGKHSAADVVAKAQGVLAEPELLRAMFDVGYFPPNTASRDDWTAQKSFASTTNCSCGIEQQRLQIWRPESDREAVMRAYIMIAAIAALAIIAVAQTVSTEDRVIGAPDCSVDCWNGIGTSLPVDPNNYDDGSGPPPGWMSAGKPGPARRNTEPLWRKSLRRTFVFGRLAGDRLGLRTNRGSNLWSSAMMDDIGDLDKIDDALMTYVSDEALEAAARVDGIQAVTVGYCTTAGTSWYCLPFWRRPAQRPQMKKTPALWARLGSCTQLRAPESWGLGACKTPGICKFHPNAYLKLYKIAHSEMAMYKSNNSVGRSFSKPRR
jgi:hypothetical protein